MSDLIVPQIASVSSISDEDLRDTVKNVASAIDLAYLALGGLLVRVNDDRNYLEYGYNSFPKYCYNELGFGERKASYLISVYKTFVVDLAVKDTQLIGIGWTNASAIAPVVDESNVDFWLEKARELSYRDLVDAVRAARQTVDNEVEPSSVVVTNVSDSGEEERPGRVIFSLFPAQEEVVVAALECAGKISGSAKPGYLLELLSMEYLGQHGDQKAFDLTWWISRLQDKYGVRLIAAQTDKQLKEVAKAILEEEL